MQVTHLHVLFDIALAGLCDVGCPVAVGISPVISASGPSPTRRGSSGGSSACRFVPRGDLLTVSDSGPLPVNLGSSGGASAGHFRISLAQCSIAALAGVPTAGVTCVPGAIRGGNTLPDDVISVL